MPSRAETQWVEISVEADEDSVDDLVNLLGRQCMGGSVIEDRPGQASGAAAKRVTVKGFLPVWDEDTRRKLEVALLLLGRISPISEPRITILKPEDWADSWKAFFPPQHIGRRTVIVPTWHEYPSHPGEIRILLDPGMAFGTGLHASTRLCLAAMERWLRPGMRVLDVGTGSGILAISAALQGANQVLAIDVDSVAVQVARDNVALNQVDGIVRVECGTLASVHAVQVPVLRPQDVDLLLINIFAEVIVDMAPAMAESLSPGGLYIASGIIASKADAVIPALQRVGLPVDERLDEEDWVALTGHKS